MQTSEPRQEFTSWIGELHKNAVRITKDSWFDTTATHVYYVHGLTPMQAYNKAYNQTVELSNWGSGGKQPC